MKSKRKGAYAEAGVNISAADRTKNLIKELVRPTFRPEVLTDIGLFGSFFKLQQYKDPVLVSSADGVGTKLKIAVLMDKHDTVGIDLVNHCINDILCCGASPLFMLDYIAAGKLIPHKIAAIVSGLAQACKEAGCALIGGETAEMPGIYKAGDYDLVGFIVGVVEKDSIIKGDTIIEGDMVLGLPSSGLHTNGYSLVRKVFGVDRDALQLKMVYPELGRTLGEELLEPHHCYFRDLQPFLKEIKGLAHITGGGFVGNIPRILPDGLSVEIDRTSWHVPPVFELIQKMGGVKDEEMYRVFNMGIGMVVICGHQESGRIIHGVPGARRIGNVVRTNGSERVIIK
ncbi:MAG: phosphoribosylformylglycinamidine cyclo-ligase [Dehalococcoidia bacterium]|nr:phosphoribosylformylglycinamidine cyclo-ligase [Dehalococcoidia bacterium]MDD5495071.1 phosphoribosylformylglycinamidine cyclo-ligase [Dehalococcoidia bacterium]